MPKFSLPLSHLCQTYSTKGPDCDSASSGVSVSGSLCEQALIKKIVVNKRYEPFNKIKLSGHLKQLSSQIYITNTILTFVFNLNANLSLLLWYTLYGCDMLTIYLKLLLTLVNYYVGHLKVEFTRIST